MRRLIVASFVTTLLISCGDSSSEKKFSVSGTISNSSAKMIYLEKIPAATMQPTLEDSAEIGKDGKFLLKSDAEESVVYNLRLDQSKYPVASVINDAAHVKLTIQLSKENSEFAEKYEVEGSRASQQMKDFMYAVNNDLQKIFVLSRQVDSLQKGGITDSSVFPLLAEQKSLADKVKQYSEESISKASDPALTMFELGYYQSTANGTGFGLEPFTNEQVNKMVNEMSMRFPTHQAIAAIRSSFEQQVNKATGAIG